MKEKPTLLVEKSLSSEKKITQAEAQRAIYIDFKGFTREAPALVGVLIEERFQQVILDLKFRGAASYRNPIHVVPGRMFISTLLALATAEDRRIVAFSAHGKEQCLRWYEIDISQRYVNAKSIAAVWSRGVGSAVRCGTLKAFEVLRGYRRSRETGHLRNTTCLTVALRDLDTYGKLRNTDSKKHWTTLRRHNRQDVEAVRHIVMATFNA